MAQTNNHINYTAEDLVLYAQGKMLPQQMHALEKAALEDAFLAEALEGYMYAAAELNTTGDNKIIAEKLGTLKTKTNPFSPPQLPVRVMPLWRQKWLQYVVAASVLIAGSWWVLSLNNKTNQQNSPAIALNEAVPMPNNDTAKATEQKPGSIITVPQNQPTLNEPVLSDKQDVATKKYTPIAAPGLAKKQTDNQRLTETEALIQEQQNIQKPTTQDVATIKSAAPPTAQVDNTFNQTNTGRGAIGQNDATNGYENNFAKQSRYTFNGKVVDANNNPLPYSNVTIPGEGVGTYSDGKGNFNFVYVDSALPVRARSIGHEDKNFTMQADAKENRIIMQEDAMLKNKMVINRQEKQARTQPYLPIIVERDSVYNAEPSVGWYNYNIYALNNNRAMELPGKRAVELSFDVNKNGEVQNVTVEKSSGKELDEEAIRLLKEGPKWKARNAKNSRTKVVIKL